jgi:putative ABC transport system permease protein
MVHAAKQQHEFAIRSALGASTGRLVRQFLSEALVVAVCSGGLGLFASIWVPTLLRLLAPTQLPRIDEIRIDGPTVLFAIVATVLTGILSGLIPAVLACRPNLSDALKVTGTRSASSGPRQNRLQGAFVAMQVAVALVVLSGAGLLIRSFVQLVKVDPGFDAEDLLVARVALGDEYSENNRQVVYFQELTKRLQSLPGVSAVGAATVLPMNSFGIDFDVPYHPAEQADLPRSATPKAKFRAVTPEYFHTMEMEFSQGRGFVEQDRPDSPRVVVVNEELAARAWPGEQAVGKRLRFFWSDWQTYEVVGVVGNTRSYGPVVDWQPELFVPEAQIPYLVMNVVIRSKIEASVMTAQVRRTMLELDTYRPPHSIVAMGDLVSDSIARERFAMTWLGVLAAISLTLATVGIYSIIAHVTAQRTKEVGIRLALGARPVDVLRLVVRQGMSLTLIGLAIGLSGSLALTRFLESLLFKVSPNDLTTLLYVSALLMVVAFFACYIPARRASKVDPLIALRYE